METLIIIRLLIDVYLYPFLIFLFTYFIKKKMDIQELDITNKLVIAWSIFLILFNMLYRVMITVNFTLDFFKILEGS